MKWISLKRSLSNFIFPWVCQSCSKKLEEDQLFCTSCQKELVLNFELTEPITKNYFPTVHPLFTISKASQALIKFSKQNLEIATHISLESFIFLKMSQGICDWPQAIYQEPISIKDRLLNQNLENFYLQKKVAKHLKLPRVSSQKIEETPYSSILVLKYRESDLEKESLWITKELHKTQFLILVIETSSSCSFKT